MKILKVLPVILIALISCSKDENDIKVKAPSVYSILIEHDNATEKQTLQLWKDGIITNITDGIKSAWGNKLLVSENNDVYIVGSMQDNSGKWLPTLWKNNEAITLTNNSKTGGGYDIFINNNDVYVAGVLDGKATYWKNGQPTTLSNVNSILKGIRVHNNDIYTVGTERPATENIATIWKNSSSTHLSNPSYIAAANKIKVHNNDVYVVGAEHNGTLNIAKYWKNGVATNVTDGSKNAVLEDIWVTDNDIYVVGREVGDTKQIAKFWKNGIATNLSQGDKWTKASNIFVHENDIYVTGFELDSHQGILWKNGEKINIPLSNNETLIYVNDVFVK